MEKYKIGKTLGDGTFGSVFEAQNIQTGQIVAVKKMKRKVASWEECIGQAEIKTLLQLSHPNVIQLLEVVKQNNEVFFIFESMQQNIYTFLKETPPSHLQIRNILYQALQGLHFLHEKDFFHRDIKPENILIRNHQVKVADLGLVRRLSLKKPLTDYISTRWYRAPEVILKSNFYSWPIDIFAIGCIMAELYLQRPLFPGASEQDQLYKILEVMGAPTKEEWPDGHKLSQKMGIILEGQEKDMGDWGGMSKMGIFLCKRMLCWNPMSRPTAKECLEHPYFKVGDQPKQNREKKMVKASQLSPRSSIQKKNIQAVDLISQARYKPGQKMSI